jgi:hypothetical protein
VSLPDLTQLAGLLKPWKYNRRPSGPPTNFLSGLQKKTGEGEQSNEEIRKLEDGRKKVGMIAETDLLHTHSSIHEKNDGPQRN